MILEIGKLLSYGILCSTCISGIAIAANRKNILKDWDWLETNLIETLGMFHTNQYKLSDSILILRTCTVLL